MSGALIIVSAPSGAGKTTLVRELLRVAEGRLGLSVSCTTRAPRAGEVDGEHYHFISVAEFEARRERGEFLEWARVHGNYYGTSQAGLTRQMAAGDDVVLEIDWQGARQVRNAFPDALTVFVLPPSFAALETRLHGRGTDAEDIIARRIDAAHAEMRHVDEFDYVIINDDLAAATADLLAIVRTSRLRPAAQRARHAGLFAAIYPHGFHAHP